jgi:DHA1 family multidrug resistance protein-like MFS transporter
MSQATDLDRDLEANPNRISQTPTIVNSVRYGPGSSTASLKQRDSDVPAVPAVPSTYTRQNSDAGSIKTDEADLDDEQYGEKEDGSNESSESQDATPPGPPSNEERNDIVTWDSEKDPDNPQNWSRAFRWYTIMILACMTFVVSFGSSVWSTATTVTATEFGVSQEVMILGVSLYVVGFALGPLIFGPLSELYGRRNPLMIGMFGFIIFQIPIGVATNLQTIFVCRFFSGAFGSAALAIVPGMAVDLFDPVERGVATMAYAAAVFAGPAVGPIVGEFTVKNTKLGWHWTAWFTMIMGAFFFCIALVTVKETFPAVILKHKAARLRQETRNWALHTKQDEEPVNFGFLFRKYGLKPVQMMIKEPILIVMTVYISLVYGILYLIFFAYPYSFQGDRQMEVGIASLPFIAIFVGVLIACAALTWETKVIFTPKFTKAKKVIPEERLPPMMVGGVVLVVGLFWFAWTSQPSINPWPQIISGVLIGCGVSLISQTSHFRIRANKGSRSSWCSCPPSFTSSTFTYSMRTPLWQPTLSCAVSLLLSFPCSLRTCTAGWVRSGLLAYSRSCVLRFCLRRCFCTSTARRFEAGLSSLTISVKIGE